MHENGIFIFRRDLRVVDNTSLIALSKKCKNIYGIFIFTPEQIGNENSYLSNNAVQFMLESLADLDETLEKKLFLFRGHNDIIIKKCINAFDAKVVAFNRDITPYAIKRDESIKKICKSIDVEVICLDDYYLHPPGCLSKGYQKFTPYYNVVSKIKVDIPDKSRVKFSSKNIDGRIHLPRIKDNPDIAVHGGRKIAKKMLLTAATQQRRYDHTRDLLELNTSMLSAAIKFGCVSIREVYDMFRWNKPFQRQLIWRDFYADIMFHYPFVLTRSMKSYDIKWKNNKDWFLKWMKAETGFPIVDAAMTQLNITGYMHNRARLITATFLVKILHINWRWGEHYFATKLVDYDPTSNNLNWQWCASTAVDSQPYFRIFNPWNQTLAHDPECVYIRRWIPQLRDVDIPAILNWDTEYVNHRDVGYYKPMCNYDEEKLNTLKLYKH